MGKKGREKRGKKETVCTILRSGLSPIARYPKPPSSSLQDAIFDEGALLVGEGILQGFSYYHPEPACWALQGS